LKNLFYFLHIPAHGTAIRQQLLTQRLGWLKKGKAHLEAASKGKVLQ
jgi:hypothetical protein